MRFKRFQRIAPAVPAVALCLTAAAVGSSVAVASASPARRVPLTPLQQGLNFYAGKTLTWVDPGAAGSTFDVTARITAPFVASYLKAAAVNVVDIPGGNSVVGSDYVAAQPPTGLVFGLLEESNVLALQLTGQTGLNFNPEREAFVGTIPNPACTVVVTKPGSGLSTFAAVLAAPASHPVVELTTPSGGTYINQRLFNIAFGVNGRLITGYSGSAPILQGFLRGDGDLIQTNTSIVYASIQGGAATPLAVNIPCPKGSSYGTVVKGVPTYSQLFQKYPAKTTDEKVARVYLLENNAPPMEGLVTQTKVPTAEITALRWAIQKAEENKEEQSQLNTSGNPYGWTSGPAAKATYITFVRIFPRIYNFLGIPTVTSS